MSELRYVLTANRGGETYRLEPATLDDAIAQARKAHAMGHSDIGLIDLESDHIVPMDAYL